MSVKLVDITKIFQDHDNKDRTFTAVNNVNIEIKDGEMVTFLGPSGCGKTTTLRIISGFEIPTSGDVFLDGQLVNDLPANKRNTSMVFQSYAIFPHLSVADNIGFGLELKGVSKESRKAQVSEIMETMGLMGLGARRPSQLSGGQQQRVALARAIVNKPSVLLFDEPLSNLDAKLREQMRTEIRRIQKHFGITSIYVTHDQAEAMTVSDRIMIMDKGVIQQIGTPFEVYSRPSNRFVADFIGRANFINGKIEEIGKENVAVRSEAGKRLIASSWNRALGIGDEVSIVVRPEGLILSGTGEGTYSGTVSGATYLGSTMEYEIDVPGFSEVVEAVSHNPIAEGFLRVGDKVGISFEPVSVHVISRTTEP